MSFSVLFALTWLLCAPHVLALPSQTERSSKYGRPRRHDANFVPDFVLRVTYEDVSIGCQTRKSALVNGSLPGPELRLIPGKTSWIRVYNDIPDQNTTMVSCTT